MRGYLQGVSLASFAAGNRRIIAAVKARSADAEPDPCEHPDHKKPSHAAHCASHPTPQAPADNTENPFLTWSKRIGGAICVLVLLWPLVGRWLPTVGAVAGLLWVLVALVAGQGHAPAAPKSAEKPATEETAADDGEWIDEEPPMPVLLALIRHVASLSDQRTAAHLPDLLAEGQQRGLFGDWTQPDLKAHLTDLKLPVVEKKKLTFSGRQYTRQAVLLEGLPEVDPAPVPAVLRKAA